jgi:hypothetical protein
MGPGEPELDSFAIDVGGLAADMVAVDLLARVALAARRRGWRLRLENPSAELLDLIGLAGLREALLPTDADPLIPRSTKPRC